MGKVKHGMADSRFYYCWQDMKKRCLNENNPSYKNYGGRGIKICQRWLDDFANFMNDMLDSYIEHVSKYDEKKHYFRSH